ncbi:MAG: hypothetical protein K2M47_05510 [Clostridiales bacterium]|nr:hypothetical protein [Clostridiales bacterium]
MKLIKHQRVSASISDVDANLSVIGVFQVVQDAVTETLGRLKMDNPTMRKQYNAVWLFTRNRAKLFNSIPWGDEQFTVTAFVSSITHATLSVDVSIKNADGVLCAYSRVETCALDLTAMRILRLQTIDAIHAVTVEKPEIDMAFTKFDCSPTEQVDTVRVASTNIDMSRHTNNVEYIRFILNTYTVKELHDKPIREMEIRYLSQSYENDVLTVYKQSCGDDKDVFLLKSSDKDTVKCEILF